MIPPALDPTLSTQATLVAIVYSLFAAFAFVFIFIPPFNWSRIFNFLIWVGFSIITVYDTNCLAIGCPDWCWIRTAFYIALPILLVITAVTKSFANTKGDNAGQVCILST